MKTITITFIEVDDLRDKFGFENLSLENLIPQDINKEIPKSDLVIFNPCTYKRKSLLVNEVQELLASNQGGCCKTEKLNNPI